MVGPRDSDRLPGARAPAEHELVARVRAGEHEQYAVLVRRYQDRLYRHALGMVADADIAADLVQDAFVKAFERLESFQDRSSFGTWVFRILRNRCLDFLKERRRKDVPLDASVERVTDRVGDGGALQRIALREVLDRALGRLPEAQREAFLLKHVQELTYEEMAEVTGASVSALRMRVLRAREVLRSLVEQELGVEAAPM